MKKVPCPSIFDPPEKYISLIIPAYNEELRFPGAVDETLSYLQQRAVVDRSFSYEVVIIDDGSTDGTAKVAFDRIKKFSVDNVRVIRLGENYGKGAAIRKGMLHARGELLLMLDADGATKITDLELIIVSKFPMKSNGIWVELDMTSSNKTLLLSFPYADMY